LTEIQPIIIVGSEPQVLKQLLVGKELWLNSAFSSNKKTVFIIGAGGSKEAGLPIGSELKTEIAKALDIRFKDLARMVSGDNCIFEAFFLAKVANDQDPNAPLRSLQQAGWHIRDAMPQAISIDNFIDTHSENKHIELCGKLAIGLLLVSMTPS